jgi:ubiquinone/menaquinone biosynthesis C-methylase UbiE
MPQASLRAWTGLIASYCAVTPPTLLDVGSGTGTFTRSLASMLPTAHCIGVEPSMVMLAEARDGWDVGRVHYLAGDAGALPLGPHRVDLALLSRVIHHVPDHVRCASELARVLRPGGTVVIRTTLRDRLDGLVYRYWPQLHDSDRERFPSLGDLRSAFANSGFDLLDVTSFAQPVHPDLSAYHDVMAARPQAKFASLTDPEFRTGLDHLRADAQVDTTGAPIAERYDVVVFRSGA